MPIIPLTDISDPRLDGYTDLRSERRSIRPDHDRFIVEGGWCVEKLSESDLTTRSVVVEAGRHEQIASQFGDDVPIYVMPRDQIRELVGFDFHRGILAEGVRPPVSNVEVSFPKPATPNVSLAVVGVSLAENLGSMIRTATAWESGNWSPVQKPPIRSLVVQSESAWEPSLAKRSIIWVIPRMRWDG